jgi:hypothetical protein
VSAEDRFWTRRLRWRLIGAWRWPIFAAAVLLDALILHQLPPLNAIETKPGDLNWPVAFIMSGFGNLAVLACADAIARYAVRKREQRGIHDPHSALWVDRGTVLALAVGVLGVLAMGLATGHSRVVATDALRTNADEVERYVLAHGGPEYRRNLETANTVRLAEGYFRTCIADDRRVRFLCLFVDTEKDPPRVVRDGSTRPNEEEAGRG